MRPLAYYVLAICCFLSTPLAAQSSSTSLATKNITTPPFSGLTIQGPVNVFIDTKVKPSAPTLQIFGNPKTVAAVTWKIKNQTLYLATKWSYWPRQGDRLTIKVNITPSQLNKIHFNSNGSLFGQGLTGTLALTATGKGCIKLCTKKLNLSSLSASDKVNITLHNLSSPNLVIQDETAGKIKIEGDIGLDTINSSGSGDLIIYWLNSSYLKINGNGTGKIFLAGIAKNLDVNLKQKVHLLAKQLRAENGFVKTQDQAYSEVTIKHKLITLAKDDSVIHYSTPVNFVNTATENTGVVLAN